MGAILAPGTVLLPDTLIPTSQLWAGNPAVYIRDVTEAEVDKSEKVKFQEYLFLILKGRTAGFFSKIMTMLRAGIYVM